MLTISSTFHQLFVTIFYVKCFEKKKILWHFLMVFEKKKKKRKISWERNYQDWMFSGVKLSNKKIF